jgi:Alcohol dehydrogenase GroES-like domain
MAAHPDLAIDLPLKTLVWEAGPSEVFVSLTSPEFLQKRHNLPSFHRRLLLKWFGFSALCSARGLSHMRAISFHQHLPIEHPESLIDVIVDRPKRGPRDLLVQIHAISVNPVDTKIRKGSGPGQLSGDLKILGWDAAGVVAEVGSDVTLFAPGDEVYYAGSVDRPGSPSRGFRSDNLGA